MPYIFKEKGGKTVEKEIMINLNSKAIDQAIEKANQLVELLREAQQIIGSLSGPEKL